VAIGGHYPHQQKRLGETIKEHGFDGDFLTWTNFPNDEYFKGNPYNCKASAFEEAIKRGYTQILWLDAPAVVRRSLDPIFDKITNDGYFTISNDKYNCAMTCSDKCLRYYLISRDIAETFQDHAGGIIGIDYNHPNGRKLLDMFITGCKEGACDGSRLHDKQSSDPRFLFHRQCQSVLSMSANIIGLPPNNFWNNGLIGHHMEDNTVRHENDNTVIVWRRKW
jgi:hypothetical protein